MSVKIRLTRRGKKKSPFYRVVVTDSRSPRDGRIIEEIGTYNPVSEPKEIKIDDEKAVEWMTKGARPTTSVAKLFDKNGISDKFEESRKA